MTVEGARACDRCRRSKRRCDKKDPCTRCVRHEQPCTWNASWTLDRQGSAPNSDAAARRRSSSTSAVASADYFRHAAGQVPFAAFRERVKARARNAPPSSAEERWQHARQTTSLYSDSSSASSTATDYSAATTGILYQGMATAPPWANDIDPIMQASYQASLDMDLTGLHHPRLPSPNESPSQFQSQSKHVPPSPSTVVQLQKLPQMTAQPDTPSPLSSGSASAASSTDATKASERIFQVIDRVVAHTLLTASDAIIIEPPPATLRCEPRDDIRGRTLPIVKRPRPEDVHEDHVLLLGVDGLECHPLRSLPPTRPQYVIHPDAAIDAPPRVAAEPGQAKQFKVGYGTHASEMWPLQPLDESDYNAWCERLLQMIQHPVTLLGLERCNAQLFGSLGGCAGRPEDMEQALSLSSHLDSKASAEQKEARRLHRLFGTKVLSQAVSYNSAPVQVIIDGHETRADPATWECEATTLLWALLHPGQSLDPQDVPLDWLWSMCVLGTYRTQWRVYARLGLPIREPPYFLITVLVNTPGFHEAMVRRTEGDPRRRQLYVRLLCNFSTISVDYRLWAQLRTTRRYAGRIAELGGPQPMPDQLVVSSRCEIDWRIHNWQLSCIGEGLLDSALLEPLPKREEVSFETWTLAAQHREEAAHLYYDELRKWKSRAFHDDAMPPVHDAHYADLMKGFHTLYGRFCCLVNLIATSLAEIDQQSPGISTLDNQRVQLQQLKEKSFKNSLEKVDKWLKGGHPADLLEEYFLTAAQE